MARSINQLLKMIGCMVIAGIQCIATPTIWSPQAARVVYLDTCSAVVITDRALGVDTGMVFIHQAFQSITGHTDSIASAGTWCLRHIVSCRGTTIQLDAAPLGFDLEASTQIVPVLSGSHVHLDSAMVVRPFDGGCGGILVAIADTISVSGSLDAAGAGYTGGQVSVNSLDTGISTLNCRWETGLSGDKGQGPASNGLELTAGRGPSFQGGGGGNARNAGGGGGALGGNGGCGGFQTSEFDALDVGGKGGQSAKPHLRYLLFGGGGGGGHQNDFTGSNGGNGGGIIMLQASVLRLSATAKIVCTGEPAMTAVSDGAGGGGAGGSVALLADTVITDTSSSKPMIDVSGGDGGSTISAYRCYGNGGGGGGGIVFVNSKRSVTSCITTLRGGIAGRCSGGGCDTVNQSNYGAAAGDSGAITMVTSPTSQPIVPCTPPDIILTVYDTTATTGSVATVRVGIDCRSPLPENVTVRMRIRTRVTVLWPKGVYWWAGRRYTVGYHELGVAKDFVGTTETFVQYLCLLGDSASVSVTVDSVWCVPATQRAVVERNGRVSVSDICNAQGTPRLFDPFANNSQPSVQPSAGAIMMVDVLGRIVQISDPHSLTSGYRRRWYVGFPR